MFQVFLLMIALFWLGGFSMAVLAWYCFGVKMQRLDLLAALCGIGFLIASTLPTP